MGKERWILDSAYEWFYEQLVPSPSEFVHSIKTALKNWEWGMSRIGKTGASFCNVVFIGKSKLSRSK